MRPNVGKTLRQAFEAKVDRSGDCWIWTGNVSPTTGRARMRVQGKKVGASRVAWELFEGPIPAGMHVLHYCDNPICVRTTHMYLGTQLNNVHDMMARHPHWEKWRMKLGENQPFREERRRGLGYALHGTANLLETVINGNFAHIKTKDTPWDYNSYTAKELIVVERVVKYMRWQVKALRAVAKSMGVPNG